MADPAHFAIEYEINPHMDSSYVVDRARVRDQWESLQQVFEALGLDVYVLDPVEGLPDMVFTANHGLFFEREGESQFLPARMKYEQRAGEIDAVVAELSRTGVHVLDPPESVFEGSGDAMTHPDDETLWVGYGPRTERAAVDEIARITGRETIGVELLTDDFYHLDTCFEHLTDDVALAYPGAIADADCRKLEQAYDDIIEISHEESGRMAGNAYCPDGENVIIDEEAVETIRKLEEFGFTVHPVDTSEFRKSGGSVYCMKLQVPPSI
ncbi:dimethylarginine dimethylaminohydrolase family protein [Haloferax namakaokahaiae]|uniref:Dimethylarginine dimethylaminohydrolase family protein n=1 Tax=Haloferax namakaokahaiae TaxID=1748331 RepID=A0ABD5ZFF7_9EURY